MFLFMNTQELKFSQIYNVISPCQKKIEWDCGKGKKKKERRGNWTIIEEIKVDKWEQVIIGKFVQKVINLLYEGQYSPKPFDNLLI